MLRIDQAQLARMIGVSRLWVNQIERGKPGAALGLILRALDALGVELTAGAMDAGRAGANSPAPVVTADIDAIVADARRRDRP
jgi:HTH-type transcriptional regulator/antitoxin HipB